MGGPLKYRKPGFWFFSTISKKERVRKKIKCVRWILRLSNWDLRFLILKFQLWLVKGTYFASLNDPPASIIRLTTESFKPSSDIKSIFGWNWFFGQNIKRGNKLLIVDKPIFHFSHKLNTTEYNIYIPSNRCKKSSNLERCLVNIVWYFWKFPIIRRSPNIRVLDR